MASDWDREILLATINGYQQRGHLCDVTLISSDGREFHAHAGILAAASSVLAQELSACERGNYTIKMKMNYMGTDAIIHFAYTGLKRHFTVFLSYKIGLLR